MGIKKKIIYRYRPINKNTLDELIHYYLYFQPAIELNDPFEFELNWANYECDTNEFIQQNNYGNSIDAGQNQFDLLKKKTTTILKNKYKPKFDKYKKQIGVCCFTQTSLNPLMWSHYSQDHTGICIGYDLSKIPENEKLIEVKYSDTVPVPPNDYQGILDFSQITKKMLETKSCLWCYEQELRLAKKIDQERKVNFSNDTICEVYFGLRTKEEDAETIGKLIHHRNNEAIFFKTKKNIGEYRLSKVLQPYDPSKVT